MSIAHIHIHDKAIVKTLHHASNIISMEAELFAIRYGINQATSIQGVLKIVIIMDLIHAAKKIFNTSVHIFQIHFASILKELRNFFSQNQVNSIEFWKCPSQCNWLLYKAVDKETKLFNPIPLFLCKSF